MPAERPRGVDPSDLELPPTQPLDLTELNDWLVARAEEIPQIDSGDPPAAAPAAQSGSLGSTGAWWSSATTPGRQ
ncbi:MAG TPA: hypothetical protein VGC45_14790 [Gryllotalpicola sp.]